jgi:hypothetical protein
MQEDKDIFKNIQPKKRVEIDDSYFDNLTSNIIVNSGISHPKIVQSVFKRKVFWVASVAAIFIVILITRSIDYKASNDLSFKSVSKSELFAYVDNNIEDFDTEILSNYCKEDPTDSLKLKTTIIQEIAPVLTNENIEEMFEGLNEEDILKYFEKNSIEVEEIEEDETI